MSRSPAPQRPPYQKPWLSCQDQVALLESRGLVVADRKAAAEFLAHVNYYRFSGYCVAFHRGQGRYPSGLTFEQVRASYDFDRDLRVLITETLEIVEVDFRAATAHHFGQKYGAFGHTDPASFFHRFHHTDWIAKLHEEADRSKEPFVIHFRNNYCQFPNLPVWIATEIMSFGALSKMYSGMTRADQKVIARRYCLQPVVLGSWMHHCAYVRNLCAHHSRLWDRIWAIKPVLPQAADWQPPSLPSNERLFATLLLLRHLMRHSPSVAPFDTLWRNRVFARINSPPTVHDPLSTMGLTTAWKLHSLW